MMRKGRIFTSFVVCAALLLALLEGCNSVPDIHRPGLLGKSRAERAVKKGGEALTSLLTPETVASADSQGRTILHLAAEAGKPDSVDAVLQAGAEVNRKDNEGKTALDLAFEHTGSRDHAEAAERLVLAGGQSDNPLFARFAPAALSSDYDLRSTDGTAPLYYAVSQGYEGYARFILEKRVDVNIKNSAGATPLHEAARTGRIDLIELLLKNGADMNAQDASGNSALHLATIPREAAALLLSSGANPNLKDAHGDSPLHIAIMLDRSVEVVQTLLEGGAAEAEPQAKGARGKAAAKNTPSRPGADVSIRNIEGKTPLYIAVEDARVDYIPLLIKYRSDIFAIDNNGGTPFETAIAENGPVIPLLITRETTLQNDSEGNTMLHAAVKNRANINTVGLILDTNAALVNARNKEGETSLHLAVRQNDAETGSLLLARGADIFASNAGRESPLYLTFPKGGAVRQWMLTPETLAASDGARNTALHYAAQWRLDNDIGNMVRLGAATEAANAAGETPLFMAVKSDSASTIRALVGAGASITARDILGNTALIAAVQNWNSQNTAETLIANGVKVNGQAVNGKTALHEAVRVSMIDPSKTDLVRLLVRNGADVEISDITGSTPLIEAARGGAAPIVKLLVDLGADPSARDIKGDSPLHIAVEAGNAELASMLLSWGVSIHAKNASGVTPYRIALTMTPRMASVLLTKDRLNVPDDFGNTPLHTAILDGADIAVVKAIAGLGANISAIDASGRTPLRLAVDSDNWEAARFLADSGSDAFHAASDGKTPAEIALDKGIAPVEALFSGGAIGGSDFMENTVLHFAAKKGDTAIIARLLDLGADKTRKNILYQSPADIARNWKHASAAALLE